MHQTQGIDSSGSSAAAGAAVQARKEGGATPPGITKYTHKEWLHEGVRRFGHDVGKWRFVCPACGHVCEADRWLKLGAERAVAFSCTGRFDGAVPARPVFGTGPGPCDYAGGGLIRLNPVEVVLDDGSLKRVFAFAGEPA